MRNKRLVIPFLLSLVLVTILVTSTVQAQENTEQIWGVLEEEEYTYTYKKAFKETGSGEQQITYKIKIINLEDWDNDNITDCEYTSETDSGGDKTLSLETIHGNTTFTVNDLMVFNGNMKFFVPIAWVNITESQNQSGGLDWDEAINTINNAPKTELLADFNATIEDNLVTIKTAEDRDHQKVNGTDTITGEAFDEQWTIEWDKSTGLLEEAERIRTYNETGLVIEETVSEGGVGTSPTLIAGIALIFSILAIIAVIIKR
ncbi:MAG: hypothetical protein Q6356_008790 [Candidatus Wukongarchaeota archaeon]|nr:hypothetical protein [Candidatus Wukongarchaeota archaeon]